MNQVIVFHQTGCPACESYLPIFKRYAVRYRPFLNIQTANLSSGNREMLDAAERFKIKAVPTTVVLDEDDELIKKVEGALSDMKIVKLLDDATK